MGIKNDLSKIRKSAVEKVTNRLYDFKLFLVKLTDPRKRRLVIRHIADFSENELNTPELKASYEKYLKDKAACDKSIKEIEKKHGRYQK